MEKIVQLSSYRYDALFEKANLNDTIIKKMAKEEYEKKGMAKLQINLAFRGSPNEYSDRGIELDVRAYTLSDESGFELTRESVKQLSVFAKCRTAEYMEDRFGRSIGKINYLNEEIRQFKRVRNTFMIVTVLGWLLALGGLILLFDK